MAVPMELARILVREHDAEHIVELREIGGDRVFPIMIGLHEAVAIQRRLLGQKVSRPQTHDLLADAIEALQARVERVLISDIRYHADIDRKIFYARLYLRQGDRVVDLDARPSDAIGLSVAASAPIFVEEHVLEDAARQ